MNAISERCTKAEILQAYRSMKAQAEQGPSWEQVATKVATTSVVVWKEFRLLCQDTYNAGAATRRWCDWVISELRRPVLKSEL